MKTRLFASLLPLLAVCALCIAQGPKPDDQRYKLLATTKTSTMEKELNEAAAQGYRILVGSPTSGKEMALFLERPVFNQIEDGPLLAANRNVFVEKADHDVDVAMIGALKKWGRWKIVADESEADLLIRLRVSGSAAWGIGHVQASILDAKTKKTLYTSKDQRGTRTLFHGYASPYTRAISGIVKQMKKDIR